MKKVGLYARVSSDSQDVDLSISAQLKALREYAKRNGSQVVKEYVDESESGRTSARPAFREMIALARRPDKPFDVILVWKYSRFTRSREDSIFYKAMLKKVGVQVISINEPFDNSPTGRLMEGIIESLDEFYSDNLGEDVTRGMRESANRGFYLSAKPPYGFRKIKVMDVNKERTRLEPDPFQANVVKVMFEAIIGGQSLTDIARDLNSRGISSPRGKKWGKTAIHEILTNEIHTGTFIWGKNSKRGLPPVRAENACLAIVDRDIFTRVQELMKDRMPTRKHPRRTASPFLLSGIARCGHCGKALTGRYAKSGKFAYYVCGTIDKTGAGACKAKYLNAERFENAVIEQLLTVVLTPENLTELMELSNRELDSLAESQRNEIDIICRSIDDVSQRLEKLYDAIETGYLDLADLALRIKELRLRQEQLYSQKSKVENELAEKRVGLIDMETMARYVADMREIVRDGSLAHKKAFIRGFVEDIQVTGNKAVLNYLIPELPHKVELDLEGVPRIVQYGGR